MPKFKLSNAYISQCNETPVPAYPKYATQIINLANQNAGATRPKAVGQLSELFPEYLASTSDASLKGWRAGGNGMFSAARMPQRLRLKKSGARLKTSKPAWRRSTSPWSKPGLRI